MGRIFRHRKKVKSVRREIFYFEKNTNWFQLCVRGLVGIHAAHTRRASDNNPQHPSVRYIASPSRDGVKSHHVEFRPPIPTVLIDRPPLQKIVSRIRSQRTGLLLLKRPGARKGGGGGAARSFSPSEEHLLAEKSCAVVKAGRHLLGELRVLGFDRRQLVGVSGSRI